MSDCSCSHCSCSTELAPSPLPPENDHKNPLAELWQTERTALILTGISLVLFALVLLFQDRLGNMAPFAFGFVLLVAGASVFKEAAESLAKGHGMDETFLMSVAAIGAFCVQQYPEGIAVMLFYQIGELFQAQAVNSSKSAISALVDLRPKTVHLVASPHQAQALLESDIRSTAPREQKAADTPLGSVILVKPGEQIPLDGVIVLGTSTLNTALLTGESMPRPAKPGDSVEAGYINGAQLIYVQTSSAFENSAIARILALLQDSQAKKAKQALLIKRFARIYTPLVVAAAAIVGLVVPTILGALQGGGSILNASLYGDWIYRALVFLVVSCPCALVISVPLTYFASIGACAKEGILVKGETYIEQLAEAKICLFDKTGTLTLGQFKVRKDKIFDDSLAPNELYALLAALEQHSNHPLAVSITAYAKALCGQTTLPSLDDTQEVPGRGITAHYNGSIVRAGNFAFVKDIAAADIPKAEAYLTQTQGQVIFLAQDSTLLYAVELTDTIKPGASDAIFALKARGITTVMLTGDATRAAQFVGDELGIDQIHAQLLPQDKVALVEKYTEQTTTGTTVFCGDGINDAPSLARADIGIAMGGLGSDAAIQAADAVFTHDDIAALPRLIKSARRTVRIAKQNIIFALTIKLGILVLATFGFASMWAAVFADVGVTIILIFNALRALKA